MKIGKSDTTAAAWVSIDERIGHGDGETTDFRVPIALPANAAVEVYVNGVVIPAEENDVLRDLMGKPVTASGRDGKSSEVQIERRFWSFKAVQEGEGEVLSFVKPLQRGTTIGLGLIGRRAGEVAFRVRPLTQKDRVNLERPESARRYVLAQIERPLDDHSQLKKKAEAESLSWARRVLKALVRDWFNVNSDEGEPLPFDAAGMEVFVNDENIDVSHYAEIVYRRAGQLAKLDLETLEAAAKN